MIYKTKKSYYTIEYRYAKDGKKAYKIKQKGFRIVIKDLTFFTDYREWITNVTEESTGGKIIHKPFKDLEETEKYLEENYDGIKEAIEKFKKDSPELSLDKLEEF